MKKNDLEFYDLSADSWWQESAKIYALYHLNQPRFDFFDRHVPSWHSLRVLDVGCGGGFSCEFMAKRGAIAFGIDQSAKCIKQAQQHAAMGGFSIEYQQGLPKISPTKTKLLMLLSVLMF